MGEIEWRFLEDQKCSRKMYCENFVDKKWEKTMERRRTDVESLERMREASEKEREASKGVPCEDSHCDLSVNDIDLMIWPLI